MDTKNRAGEARQEEGVRGSNGRLAAGRLRWIWGFLLLVLAVPAVGRAVLPSNAANEPESRTLEGAAVELGEGQAWSYVDLGQDGAPTAIGVAFTEGALTGLPTQMNMTSRCFDKDGSGAMTHGECLGDYQSDLALPSAVADLGLPFRWLMLNWNPEGHFHPAPPVWGAPHFDVHFYMSDPDILAEMRPGPCGELIDCEDHARASAPLPADYLPHGYIDVGATVPAMGNHLVDSADPEILDPSLGFSRTLIFGTWDARMIFIEPMVSLEFLTSRPDACSPVRAPASWAIPGYYPTEYCVRFDSTTGTYRIGLEGLTLHAGT